MSASDKFRAAAGGGGGETPGGGEDAETPRFRKAYDAPEQETPRTPGGKGLANLVGDIEQAGLLPPPEDPKKPAGLARGDSVGSDNDVQSIHDVVSKSQTFSWDVRACVNVRCLHVLRWRHVLPWLTIGSCVCFALLLLHGWMEHLMTTLSLSLSLSLCMDGTSNDATACWMICLLPACLYLTACHIIMILPVWPTKEQSEVRRCSATHRLDLHIPSLHLLCSHILSALCSYPLSLSLSLSLCVCVCLHILCLYPLLGS